MSAQGAPATVVCRAIGVVRSRFTTPEGTPIQTAAAPDEAARIEIDAAYAAGLADIDGFDHLLVITSLHLATQEKLRVTPFLDTQERGVFATRAPVRPNHLGLSIVRLLRLQGSTLHIAGCDMVDGTPVLDIKPYVPQFDARTGGRIGWFANNLSKLAGTVADARMQGKAP